MQNHKKGNIFIISAASGTGKTTLVLRLLKSHDNIRVSASHTTCQPRGGEVRGMRYHFVPKDEFESLIEQRAFLEHVNVPGDYYGTSTVGVNSLSEEGYGVILGVDMQGAAQTRESLPEASSIFILPSSSEVLTQRLIDRGTDNEEVTRARLSKARHEVEQSVLFDYAVVNDDSGRAKADLLHVIEASRLKKSAQQGFISNLLKNL